MKFQRRGGAFLIALVAGTTLGCSEDGAGEPGVPDDVGLLLVADVSGDVAYPAAEVPGRLSVVDDCIALDGLPVLWPSGTTWDQDTQEVVMSDGDRFTLDSRIIGGGGVVSKSVAGNYGGTDVQEAVDECAARLNATNMALLSSASPR